VGADPEAGNGRGVVSTANYKAREYGIRSAMPISKAWRLSESFERVGRPAAIFLPVDGRKYALTSEKIMAIIRRHAAIVAEASIDEAFVDLSVAGNFKKAEHICRVIKKSILSEERLTVSVGLGPNKLIAKIASDFRKPNGLTVIEPDKVADFLAPLAIKRIPGIGPKTENLLQFRDIRTVADLRVYSQEYLVSWLGKWGADIYKKARGIDESPVLEYSEIKSIGEQETYSEDSRDMNILIDSLFGLSRRVYNRFTQSGFKNFRTLTLTVRFDDFETRTRSRTIHRPIGQQASLFEMLDEELSEAILQFEALKLLIPFIDKRENPNRKFIRLLGLRVENFI